ERVGINEDFFEAGGHSLLATQVTARGRKLLGGETPLRSLFENPTGRGLSREGGEALSGGAGRRCGGMKRVSRGRDLALSFAEQRLWFLDQLEPGSATYNLPAAVLLNGRLNVAALGQALNGIVKRHESLRTRFVEVEGQPAQIIDTAESLILPEIDV